MDSGPKGKGLHFLHLNVRSLIPKISEVRLLLQRTKASVLALSESWLDGSIKDAEINVDGYSVVRKDRDRHGGGVLLYISDGVAFNPRPELSEDGFECIWVELLMPKSKGILIGSC